MAFGSVALLAAYPFAVFFSASYTEALSLLGNISAFYHFRRQKHAVAGAWGLLVGLTKQNGVLLGLPLLLVWVSQSGFLGRRRGASRARGLLAVLMPDVGMLIFSAFVYELTGNPLACVEVQQ